MAERYNPQTDISRTEAELQPRVNPHLLSLLRAAGHLSHICDHREHGESSPYAITDISHNLRQTAVTMAANAGRSLANTYAARIRAFEKKSPRRFVSPGEIELAGTKLLDQATTWRQLQLGQLAHDEQFHPDVWGMCPENRIHHYAFHLAKLPWQLAEAFEQNRLDDFYRHRLADVAIFGVILATAIDLKLPDDLVNLPLSQAARTI